MSDAALVPIVNRDDQLIGYKPRGSLVSQDITRIVALWVTNAAGEVLLAQRAWTKKFDPGLWSCAAVGMVEGEEAYAATIAREAQEEIGLQDINLIFHRTIFYDGVRPYVCGLFSCVVDQPAGAFARQVEEVEALKWLSVADLVAAYRSDSSEFVPSFYIYLDHFGYLT